MRSKQFLFFCLPLALSAQTFTQRGFFEGDFFGYPLTTLNDSGVLVGEAMFRWDMTYKPESWLSFSAGVEAQTDTHRQTERDFHLNVQDRGLLRPAFSIR